MLHLTLLAALATASAGDGPWSLAVGLGTELPVASGAQLTLEGPARVRVGASTGRLPNALVSGLGDASATLGVLDEQDAEALSATASAAWVLGGSVGWRPFEAAGLWMAGDWRSVRCSTQADRQAVSTALGVELEPQELVGEAQPAALALSSEPYTVSMRATLLGGSIGWDQVIAERVILRFSVGALALRSARTEIDPGSEATPPERALTDQANQDLEALFSRRLLTPTLGLGLAWRFG